MGNTGNKEFSAEDVKLLSMLGTQAALGIENSILGVHENADLALHQVKANEKGVSQVKNGNIS